MGAFLAMLTSGFMLFACWLGIGEKLFFFNRDIPLWYNLSGGILFLAIPLILAIYMEATRPETHSNPGIGAGWPGHYDDW